MAAVSVEGKDGWGSAAHSFQAWRAGDPAGLERLVRMLTPVLWHVARSYGLNRSAAEDVVQTTWLNLVRKADSVREPQAVWNWVTVAARREAWRIARADGKASLMEPAALTLVGGAAPDDDPEATVMADETAVHLWRHVSTMSERCRRLLRVIAFAERPDYGRLATELDMPVGSIGPTRGRCLKKLRDLVAADLETSER